MLQPLVLCAWTYFNVTGSPFFMSSNLLMLLAFLWIAHSFTSSIILSISCWVGPSGTKLFTLYPALVSFLCSCFGEIIPPPNRIPIAVVAKPETTHRTANTINIVCIILSPSNSIPFADTIPCEG